MDLSRHTEVAAEELTRRRLGVTSQVLSVHAAPLPIPVAVDAATDPSSVFFFFALPNERYHFWIRVALVSAELQFAGVAPLSAFELVLTSERMRPTEISERLEVQPTRVISLGESVRPGAAPAKKNSWVWEPVAVGAGFFETRLERFLAATVPLAPRVRELTGCEAEVSVASYQWAAWPDGFHVSRRTAAALAELGGSFDIDLYCSGPAETGA
ncbi:MAG: DUF4279 domain-containing protein [Acidobacteriota bacterium]